MLLHAHKKLTDMLHNSKTTTVLQHVSITCINKVISITLKIWLAGIKYLIPASQIFSVTETQYGMILYTVEFPFNIISCNPKSISSI
jgi:hypothetical protein